MAGSTSHLFLPSIFGHLAAQRDFSQALPHWSNDLRQSFLSTLYQARYTKTKPVGLWQQIFDLGGGREPLANALAKADGVALADEDWALLVEPISLKPYADSLQIDAWLDAKSLVGTNWLAPFNATFKDDGFCFVTGDSGRCYLQVNDQSLPKPSCTPPDRLLSRNLLLDLPWDKSGFWKARCNEFQMLLHSLDFQWQRQSEGLPAFNGLWLWGNAQPPMGDDGLLEPLVLVSDAVDAPLFAKAMGLAHHAIQEDIPEQACVLWLEGQQAINIFLTQWLPDSGNRLWTCQDGSALKASSGDVQHRMLGKFAGKRRLKSALRFA